jgi:hypothetical protein
MAGRPFVVLGVNTDEDRQAIKAVIAKEELKWRSWWDGGSTEGPIVTQWQIGNWPTLYVIDGKSVIRYIEDQGGGVDVEPLEAAIEKLVRAAETAPGNPD